MTLTETATLTKRTLVALIILSVLGITGFFGYQYYYFNFYLPSQPVVEEQPELKFGLLPKLEFPDSLVSSSNFTYTIDTKTGGVPENLPKLINVYFIPPQSATLLAPDRARELAKSLSFNSGPDLVSATKYRFSDNNEGEILIDLNTGNFEYQREVATESADLINLPDQTQIAQEFKTYLSQKELLKEQIVDGRTKISFDRASQNTSNKAIISLWQEDINDLKVVTPNFKEGLIRGEISKFINEVQKFSALKFVYWQIDKNTHSTYPLKNAKTALDELRNGLGSIIEDPKKGQVSITDIYLAYYLPEKYTRYLQPVYVFQGEGFTAYVSAIDNLQIEKEASGSGVLKQP